MWTTKEHREELFFSCVRALSGTESEKSEKRERDRNVSGEKTSVGCVVFCSL